MLAQHSTRNALRRGESRDAVERDTHEIKTKSPARAAEGLHAEAFEQERLRYMTEQRRTVRDRRLRANVRCLMWLALATGTAVQHEQVLHALGI